MPIFTLEQVVKILNEQIKVATEEPSHPNNIPATNGLLDLSSLLLYLSNACLIQVINKTKESSEAINAGKLQISPSIRGLIEGILVGSTSVVQSSTEKLLILDAMRVHSGTLTTHSCMAAPQTTKPNEDDNELEGEESEEEEVQD